MGYGNACRAQCFFGRYQTQTEDQRYLLHNLFDQVLYRHAHNDAVLLSGVVYAAGRHNIANRDFSVKLCLWKVGHIGESMMLTDME